MILLDTCTLLWLSTSRQHRNLSASAKEILNAPTSAIWVSAISVFEIAQKYAKGKLGMPLPPDEWFEEATVAHHLKHLPLDIPSAVAAAALPPIHNDPFDRLLIATAMHHRLTILTPDPKIHAYPDVDVRW